MKHHLSFAVTLHRVFDSAPPEAKALFRTDNQVLSPTAKPGGLYVFSDIPPEIYITAECRGYLPEKIILKAGQVTPVSLYPSPLFSAPPGWKTFSGKGIPDELLYWADESYNLRLKEFDSANGTAQLHTKKNFVGGTLLLSKDGYEEKALILEKQPPDVYLLYGLTKDFTGGSVKRIYPARVDCNGEYCIALPRDAPDNPVIQ